MLKVFKPPSSEPSSTRMGEPSKVSQYVILRSLPVVMSCDSSGWNAMLLNNVESNKHLLRVRVARSQTMHEPSPEADTARASSLVTLMSYTRLLCSFMDASMTWLPLPRRQTRTSPSSPPEMIRPQSLVVASEVTPLPCASLMTYSSRPLCGRKALILSSDQPLTSDRPSAMKAMHEHSVFGTWMRRSSLRSLAFQTRMSWTEHVANTEENEAGKHT
mmetsp:Transcript_7854/g.23273  ORF Transcript_7854/g.23273 Transcript_7854/m.23273 type:complete len:217 (+) Transcript_7854:273-923(+)